MDSANPNSIPIVLIGGSAGTGKTVISNEIGSILNYDVLHLSNMSRGLLQNERYKDTILVSPEELFSILVDRLRYILKNDTPNGIVIEGHILCDMPLERMYEITKNISSVILRVPPHVLYNRLVPRGYGTKKICENMLSEVLDYSVQMWGIPFFEYESTGDPITNANAVIDIISRKDKHNIKGKHIDYTKHLDYVLSKCNKGVYMY